VRPPHYPAARLREEAGEAESNPVPYLLAVAMASNIGSTATITGNSQNMMIGSFSQIPYAQFTASLAPVALVGLVLAFVLIALFHRDEFAGGARLVAVTPPAAGRSSLQTRRWREQDSNHRSRVTRPIFQSPLVGSPPTEKSERKRTDTRSVGPFPGGTDGSNPVPSSGESVSRGISSSHVEKPGFSRGRAGWGRRRGRQRRAWRGDMAPIGGNISVGPYSSTAVLPMWFATVPALARKRGPVAFEA
jgi:hypothetical protein